MRKLIVFENVTVDGYFCGPEGDLSWAHRPSHDEEWGKFVAGNAGGGGELLFGRVTYEMMIQYWPTPQAAKNDPEVARHMNAKRKYVASKSLQQPAWENTSVLKGELVDEVRKLKAAPGEPIVLLGSGTLVSQLFSAGLIDEIQLAVHPVVLGAGRTLFEGAKRKGALKLTDTRRFENGNVLLSYAAA